MCPAFNGAPSSWSDMSLDIVTGLTPSEDNTIFTEVDRFFKTIPFILFHSAEFARC